MANNVRIGIDADLDTRSVEQQINQLGQKIAQANKVQFQPVSLRTTADLDKVIKQFDQLRRVQGDLNRRIKTTGQDGAGLWNLDWEKLYPNQSSRAGQMRRAFEYSVGNAFGASLPAPGGGGGRQGGGGNQRSSGGGAPGGAGTMAVQVAQAGLRAAGPVGGVASSALGTGMSAGFGAGLMGLLGGVLALGVGKLVGAVTEKIGAAEDNAVALDKLKRVVGDVQVSFGGLKAVVQGSADNLKITYAEAGQLATQFAKLGNVSGTAYKSLGEELGVGVGMSRSFGLDPSQGVGFMGQMRGVRQTSDVNDSKRMALLIGETIGKSGAFAKADEVMGAIASYTETQTRQSMSRANVEGYAGMFSSMVGSGIVGLDPSGASSILSKMNATLSAGGGHGEASQFFSAMVGNNMGLDPIQSRILREGGMFATKSGMFGKDSAYAKFMGEEGPQGNSTFLEETMEYIKKMYPGRNKQEKLIQASVVANHAGVNVPQAMAMLSLKPNQMGEMAKYGNLKDFNEAGIGNLSKVLFGSDDDRKSVADSMMRRDDLSSAEKNRIDGVMKGGDVGQQKQILAELVAAHDQESTDGKNIRDSKNALDNIKTSLADKMVPLMNEMRLGIMHMAGYDKGKTSQDIMKDVIKADSDGRIKSIKGKFSTEEGELGERWSQLELQKSQLNPMAIENAYKGKPEIIEAKNRERLQIMTEMTEIERRLKSMEEEKTKLLDQENTRRENEIAAMDQAARDRAVSEAQVNSVSITGEVGGGSGGRGKLSPASPEKTNKFMKYFMSKGWDREDAAGLVASIIGESGGRYDQAEIGGGSGYGLAQWTDPKRKAAFKARYGHDITKSTEDEQLDFMNYELTEGGFKNVGNMMKGAKTGPRGSSDQVVNYYEIPADKAAARALRGPLAENLAKTPLPEEGAGPGRGSVNPPTVGSAEITVKLVGPDGKPVAPPQQVKTKLSPAKPNGAR